MFRMKIFSLFLLMVTIQNCSGSDTNDYIHPPNDSENAFKSKTDDQKEPTTTPATVANTPKHIWNITNIGKYEDTTDYRTFGICGNLVTRFSAKCFCGNETLIRMDSSASMCCISPDSTCFYTKNNTKDVRNSDVLCKDGVVQSKLLPCHGKCFNDYNWSAKLWQFSHFPCPELNYCVPIQDMCSGLCPSEQETCNESLRCYESGWTKDEEYDRINNTQSFRYDKLDTLTTEYVDGHKYCSVSVAANNQQFNQISRLDEDKILPDSEDRLDLQSLLQPCKTDRGEDGFVCDNAYDKGDDGFRCRANEYWCVNYKDKCDVGNTTISLDHEQICRNYTLLREMSCDSYYDLDVFNYGLQCTGNSKACYFPYYSKFDGNPKGARLTCTDKSHMKFPTANVTCSTFNEQFIKQHRQQWCECTDTSNQWCREAKNSTICKDPESWLKEQSLNKLTFDPHQCESSCQEPGPDCLGMPSNYK